MNQYTKIAILGGGGKTGKFLVNQLVRQGYQLKLLLRHPENFKIESPLIEIIKGDAVDEKSIQLLLKDCEAVISTVGQRLGEPLVPSQACVHVLKSMTTFKIRRYIRLAGLNLDTPFDNKGEKTRMGTEYMKTHYPVIHVDIQKMYGILSASDVDWTVVRVPLIEFAASKGKLIVDLEDCKGDHISAADIATFLIEQLSDDTYFKKAPFLANS